MEKRGKNTKNKTITAQQALELLASVSVVALILPPKQNSSHFLTATRSELLFVILTHMSSKGQASNTKPLEVWKIMSH